MGSNPAPSSPSLPLLPFCTKLKKELVSDTSADMQCFAGRAEAGKNAGTVGGRAGQGRAGQGRAEQGRANELVAATNSFLVLEGQGRAVEAGQGRGKRVSGCH